MKCVETQRDYVPYDNPNVGFNYHTSIIVMIRHLRHDNLLYVIVACWKFKMSVYTVVWDTVKIIFCTQIW